MARRANPTVDRFGRVLIPKQIRDEIGLEAGTPLIIECSGGSVTIRKREEQGAIVEVDGLLVHTGKPTGDLERAVRSRHEERVADLMRRSWER